MTADNGNEWNRGIKIGIEKNGSSTEAQTLIKVDSVVNILITLQIKTTKFTYN